MGVQYLDAVDADFVCYAVPVRTVRHCGGGRFGGQGESFSFSLKLASAANCRSYGGNNISTFNPQNADKDRGSYESGTVEVTNNGTSSTIHLKERKNFKNAYYLLLPFTMTVKVPAYTCYKVTLSYDIKLQRNANGESWYVMEWTDNTDGASLQTNLFCQ